MSRMLTESGWKLFRKLQETALERFCERVLTDAQREISKSQKTNRERYRSLFKLFSDRDELLANVFDNPRRSDAFRQLASLIALDLLTENELTQFSAETQSAARTFAELL